MVGAVSSAGVISAEVELKMRATVLGNGFCVLIREVHAAPLASVWCWYRVGLKDASRATVVVAGPHEGALGV
jgi:hypothetical protein